MPLTPKQQRFVDEYLVDFNATAAYVRAGYKDTPAAHANSARLIANDSIKEAIDKGRMKVSEQTELTVEWILAGLQREAANFGEGSSPSARVRALELLGKYKGMQFTDHIEVQEKVKKRVVIEVVTRREEVVRVIADGSSDGSRPALSIASSSA